MKTELPGEKNRDRAASSMFSFKSKLFKKDKSKQRADDGIVCTKYVINTEVYDRGSVSKLQSNGTVLTNKPEDRCGAPVPTRPGTESTSTRNNEPGTPRIPKNWCGTLVPTQPGTDNMRTSNNISSTPNNTPKNLCGTEAPENKDVGPWVVVKSRKAMDGASLNEAFDQDSDQCVRPHSKEDHKAPSKLNDSYNTAEPTKAQAKTRSETKPSLLVNIPNTPSKATASKRELESPPHEKATSLTHEDSGRDERAGVELRRHDVSYGSNTVDNEVSKPDPNIDTSSEDEEQTNRNTSRSNQNIFTLKSERHEETAYGDVGRLGQYNADDDSEDGHDEQNQTPDEYIKMKYKRDSYAESHDRKSTLIFMTEDHEDNETGSYEEIDVYAQRQATKASDFDQRTHDAVDAKSDMSSQCDYDDWSSSRHFGNDYSNQAASIFFGGGEAEPEERVRKMVLNDENNNERRTSQTSA